MENINIIAQKQILSFKEALLYLDLSSSFLYKLTSQKAIPFSKPNGGKIYFRKSDLDNWMLSNIQKTKEEAEQGIMNYINKKDYGSK